jgi:kynureninase
MRVLTRDDCVILDNDDPLKAIRTRFRIPGNTIYLDGNSLGALTISAEQRIQEVVHREWGVDLIRSWNVHEWVDYPRTIGDRIARFIGAANGETLVCDSTSVDLFKLAGAVSLQRGGRTKIVTESGNFPTDLYILQGLAQLLPGVQICAVPRIQLLQAIDDQTFLVVLTHVHYRTAEVFDLDAVTSHAHAFGARIIWDLSHSVGALPINLGKARADFAVGCTYKYLNGGPGSPGFLFVRRDLQESLQPVLSGWLGDARPFEFLDDYMPASGIDRHRCGTPPVLSFAALDGALDAFDGVDLEAVRTKSIRLADVFIDLVERTPGGEALKLASPRDAASRGSHISFAHENAYELMQRLIARGVIGDFRAPDLLRFGLTPLYLRYVDVWDAVQILIEEAVGLLNSPSSVHARLKVT